MSGLQGWAQAELRRQNVKDLTAAVAAAEALVDYKAERTESADAEKSKSKGSKNGKKKNGNGDDGKDKQFNGNSEPGKPSTANSGCFICQGPHRARECPKKEKLNALVAANEQGEWESVTTGEEDPITYDVVFLYTRRGRLLDQVGECNARGVCSNRAILLAEYIQCCGVCERRRSCAAGAVNDDVQPWFAKACEVAVDDEIPELVKVALSMDRPKNERCSPGIVGPPVSSVLF
ncbi:hypothetical protein MRB53_020873 [Persea americana]|uniref:Uncharacterized protein n=2 Tax=Persea americana TaxID=3435 RepID=A0ACC2L2G9_PERAE|nr:hypothetical protein MRB53_020869 [Persea americana]KAJ8627566.1 hypothetical protein MRB53_020873 [Persea americana]